MAEKFFKFFRRSAGKDQFPPGVDRLLNLCKETIEKPTHFSSTKLESEDYSLMNRHQCELLAKKLSETLSALVCIQQLSLFDEKTVPVLEELHRALVNAKTHIQSSNVHASDWLRAAIEQGDMKETFQKLVYDVQWHMDVLDSILVDNSRESRVTFEPASCYSQLKPVDEIALLIAMKKDDELLKERLSSLELDDPTEQQLADQLLKQMTSSESSGSSAQLLDDNIEAKEQLPGNSQDSNDPSSVTSSFDMLFLDPLKLEDYYDRGILIGKGSFGEVWESNLMGGKYAIKIFEATRGSDSFKNERETLRKLRHHPQIVRLFCYSENESNSFLIMERMHMDLCAFLRRRNSKGGRKFSIVEAVDLMLQIAEGVRYIHSKGMAHRDLKPQNVLVNLADVKRKTSSRVNSVKIADFGLTKTKNSSRTYSNQTLNTGSTKWMAPEVIAIAGEGFSQDSSRTARFNPRKADVYSFAIICSQILTGEEPYKNQVSREVRKNVKEGAIRPELPNECPPRLASLIQRCWAGCYVDRPLFPEICKELRYIKGLVLRGDEEKLKIRDVILGFEPNAVSVQHQEPYGYKIDDEENEISHITASMEHIKRQGPWGASIGNRSSGVFSHVAKSIKWIMLTDNATPPGLGLVEVGYVEPDDIEFVERYCYDAIGSNVHKIEFGPGEFIKQISGSVAPHEASSELHSVVSLTIYTNCRTHGPYGEDVGQQFTSGSGKVVGFHGAGGARLHTFGVWIILDGLDDGDQSLSPHGQNILSHQSLLQGNINPPSSYSPYRSKDALYHRQDEKSFDPLFDWLFGYRALDE